MSERHQSAPLTARDFDALPSFRYGLKLPSSAAISAADKATYTAARESSDRLVLALVRYFERREAQ